MLPAFHDRYLYPQSPFVPQVSIASAYQITAMVNQYGLHPATAIAREARQIGKAHFSQSEVDLEWIFEKFPIDTEGYRDFVYGLMLAPSLIIALDMIQEYSHEETFAYLFNVEGEDFDHLAGYTAGQIERARKLVRWTDPNPMATGKPIYDHCAVEILSFNPWYLVGLEASRHVFNSFAQLFEVVLVEDEESPSS